MTPLIGKYDKILGGGSLWRAEISTGAWSSKKMQHKKIEVFFRLQICFIDVNIKAKVR
jgi:hypothetical protein